MPKIGKVAEYTLPPWTQPGVYRLYSVSISVVRVVRFCLNNEVKALGGERPELTGSSLLPRCFFRDMRHLSEKFST